MIMKKIAAGDRIKERTLETIQSSSIPVPSPDHITHLQFRRFSGCPICNLHIQPFIRRYKELEQSGIREVIVFHSSGNTMLRHHVDTPFPMIADPGKILYKEFGVEASILSLLHPRALSAAMRGTFRHGVGLPGFGETPFGRPADFLIDQKGKILACKYGVHAYDQWTVDEVLALVNH